ncbi:unnamed protein product, partial [Mesorhabditis belari]|uniref:Uncharacterized protein n=1 Tax=Mesorhabditis belari TaxID=2138241 RepID=A0AAF3FUW3_9BILA
MMDKEVKLDLPDNLITKSTIKSAFLLDDDAVISLSYGLDDHQKYCRVNEAGTTFLLPDGWPAIQFFVDSNKAPSRPETPADIEAQFSDYKRDRPESPYVIDEKLASELCNRLFFAPRA